MPNQYFTGISFIDNHLPKINTILNKRTLEFREDVYQDVLYSLLVEYRARPTYYDNMSAEHQEALVVLCVKNCLCLFRHFQQSKGINFKHAAGCPVEKTTYLTQLRYDKTTGKCLGLGEDIAQRRIDLCDIMSFTASDSDGEEYDLSDDIDYSYALASAYDALPNDYRYLEMLDIIRSIPEPDKDILLAYHGIDGKRIPAPTIAKKWNIPLDKVKDIIFEWCPEHEHIVTEYIDYLNDVDTPDRIISGIAQRQDKPVESVIDIILSWYPEHKKLLR